MFCSRVKAGVYVLEALNAFATSAYFNYLFFHMRDQFGFTNLGNLCMCAVNGGVYCVAVWFGGKFAQRRGHWLALWIGFSTMGISLGLGSLARTVSGQYLIMIVWTLGMSLTWPVLEAMVSEREPPHRLQRLLGIYNLVWATSSGLAYFVGGAMLEKLGRRSIFLLPAALHLVQVGVLFWLGRQPDRAAKPTPNSEDGLSASPAVAERRRSPVTPQTFLKMAWVANPFAYLAINGMLPVIPKLAERFELGPMLAGFLCSIWFFGRALAFLGLWLWTGWHYRFRWLVAAYVAVGICFAGILLGTRLWVLVVLQIVFGAAVGLIYYSSLYYSMDVGETKSEHGGFHEAALGAGICVGPAIGAASLRFYPADPNMNAWAVAGLVTLGLIWLLALRWRRSG